MISLASALRSSAGPRTGRRAECSERDAGSASPRAQALSGSLDSALSPSLSGGSGPTAKHRGSETSSRPAQALRLGPVTGYRMGQLLGLPNVKS